ncbi:hypothetical protein F5Y13DRAFT_171963 [Hypoxylon sp. FL1857]|nr:hypothetical protein F5Y13DRAFT_171963 [Hypoxylon sp. FL1857]
MTRITLLLARVTCAVLVFPVDGAFNNRASNSASARIDRSCYRFEVGLGAEVKRATVVRIDAVKERNSSTERTNAEERRKERER